MYECRSGHIHRYESDAVACDTVANLPRVSPGFAGRGWKYLVIRRRETDPWEVSPFTNEPDATEYFDRASEQWSDTFLVEIKKGPLV